MEGPSSSSSLLSTPTAIVEASLTQTVKELAKKKQMKVKQTESKRKSLTGAQKAEICCLKQKGLSQVVALANQFGVAETTVSNILREKTRWLSLDPISYNAILK